MYIFLGLIISFPMLLPLYSALRCLRQNISRFNMGFKFLLVWFCLLHKISALQCMFFRFIHNFIVYDVFVRQIYRYDVSKKKFIFPWTFAKMKSKLFYSCGEDTFFYRSVCCGNIGVRGGEVGPQCCFESTFEFKLVALSCFINIQWVNID